MFVGNEVKLKYVYVSAKKLKSTHREIFRKFIEGTGIVVQQVKPPIGMPASRIKTPVQVPATAPPNQLPSNAPGKQQMMAQVLWGVSQ